MVDPITRGLPDPRGAITTRASSDRGAMAATPPGTHGCKYTITRQKIVSRVARV
jgi:hypothetical protein